MPKQKVGFILLIIVLAACVMIGTKEKQSIDGPETEASHKNAIAREISLDSLEGISDNDAMNLCYDVLGREDKNHGFPISYRCIGAVEYHDMGYFVIEMSWLVEEHHWSQVGLVMVCENGKEIYDGWKKGETYFLGEKRWSRDQGTGR